MAALRTGPIADVSSETVTLRVAGVDVPAIHARPDGMPVAGVVVHPDVMGLRPLFDDLCRRLATHGLAVLAVEPFARIPEAERASLDAAGRLARVSELDDEVQLGDLEAAANRLVVDDGVARVGIVGFCIGGYFTLKAAATDRYDTAVDFYGMLRTPDAWRSPRLADPVDTAADVCPTLAVFGTADPWTPAADIAALRAAWAARSDCEIVEVEGADHGFVHDPERPAHRGDDAARVWELALGRLLP